MAPESQPSAPGDALDDATTQAEGEWPVAPQYHVVPEPDREREPRDGRGAVAFAAPPPPRRSGLPVVALIAAVLALLVLGGAAAAWIVTRPDDSSASLPPAGSQTGQITNTPHNGGATNASATTTSTGTTESTTTTTATVAVPGVVGLTAADAARKLRDAKLVPIIRLVASRRPGGTVLVQVPASNANVGLGTKVELRVAKEPSHPMVILPRLVGSTAATAKGQLRSLGLHWSVTTRASARPRGTVLDQSPSGGARMAKGATVDLTISSGQAQVSVPNVIGLDEANARAQLMDAGFDVSVVDQPTTDPIEDGVVVDQSPSGGSSAAEGSSVTITIGRSG
jgi:beta-lactam-binding protein with PASTA domain